MEQRMSLVSLGVADLLRSRRFYERLGWKASGASQESIAFWDRPRAVRPGGARSGCLFTRRRQGFGGVTLAHNVRTREEVDAVLDRARTAGARILKPAQEPVWGGYSGYFADPDGDPWEVAWNPQFPLRNDGSVHLPE